MYGKTRKYLSYYVRNVRMFLCREPHRLLSPPVRFPRQAPFEEKHHKMMIYKGFAACHCLLCLTLINEYTAADMRAMAFAASSSLPLKSFTNTASA